MESSASGIGLAVPNANVAGECIGICTVQVREPIDTGAVHVAPERAENRQYFGIRLESSRHTMVRKWG